MSSNACGKPGCSGAIAAMNAVPPKHMIDIGGDIAEAADRLRRVEELIDRGLDVHAWPATMARLVRAHIDEALRQLAIIRAECERLSNDSAQ